LCTLRERKETIDQARRVVLAGLAIHVAGLGIHVAGRLVVDGHGAIVRWR
jgi:uncharacterized protein (UPF0276 family)